VATLPDSAGLARDSRQVALGTLVSRASGFARIALVAAVLGPTYFGNLFQTAIFVPLLAYEILSGPVITAALLPRLVLYAERGDQARIRRLASGFLGVLLLALAAVAVACALAMPLLLGLITAAVQDPAILGRQRMLGACLLIATLPQLLLYGIASVGIAVQQVHRRFALAAAAPALENLSTIAVFLASTVLFPPWRDVDDIGAAHALFLGLGSTLAVGLHAAAQWWGAWRLSVPLQPCAGWKDREVRSILGLALPSSISTGLNMLGYFAVLIVAGRVPGGTVAFQIGYAFFNLPVALCARPVAAAQVPRLAQDSHREVPQAFHALFREGLALTSFVALPAGLLLVGMPGILARAVSFGGMAGAGGSDLAAAAIGGLGLGVFGEAIFIVSTAAAYARGDVTSPLRAVLLRVAMVGLGLPLVCALASGRDLIWALAIMVSLACLAGAAYLYISQTRGLPSVEDGRAGGFLLANLTVSGVAVGAGMLLARELPTRPGPGQVLVAAAAVGVSGAAYLALQWLRGSTELRNLLAVGTAPGRAKPTGIGVEQPPCI
jgi:putative peptidoglycan lipid II flippase